MDPWFREPLWLTALFRGEVVWAFNSEHLQLLRGFVAADLREPAVPRLGMSVLEKLPSWLTSAANRSDLLKVFDDLTLLAGAEERGRRPVLEGKPTETWR